MTRVVRTPLRARNNRGPAFDERLFIRRPALLRRGAAFAFRLPHGSKLRRSLLTRNAELSYAAQNRRDWRFVVAPYDERSELLNVPISGGGSAVAVVQDRYVGREGALRLLEDWAEPFEDLRFEPRELLDLGDGRLLILSTMSARGRVSGVEIHEPLAQLVEFRDGMVTRQRNWLGSWDDGLAAAGVS